MFHKRLRIENTQARRLWLTKQHLSATPCGKRGSQHFAARVADLGMVQLDSIGVLARAHHHILWSRQTAYRTPAFDQLLQGSRSVFEHFSHDAAILPMSTYPYWERQRSRRGHAYRRGVWGREMPDQKTRRQIVNRIEKHGPQCSRDFSEPGRTKPNKSIHAWMRPAHKLALDYLWLSGKLSVSHRVKFNKYYDLTERVIPLSYREQRYSEQEQIDWLCEFALDRLGFASALEIQRFWEACDLGEVQAWIQRQKQSLLEVEVESANGQCTQAYAPMTIESELQALEKPSRRVRIVNPFDPVVRDRDRLARLFGFEYRIEIYTPASKRRYGYYVYPILEGDRFIGRIDVRADRKEDLLKTTAWWLEPGVRDSTGRRLQIEKELSRLSRLANVNNTSPLPTLSPNPA
ncbi:MAG: winged helix-turn-helix domain-containing protein [Granulosicoccus sp.]